MQPPLSVGRAPAQAQVFDPAASDSLRRARGWCMASLGSAGVVLLSIVAAIVLESGGPLFIGGLAWLAQIIAGFVGFASAQGVLGRIKRLNLPVPLEEARGVRVWSIVGLLTAIFGIVGAVAAVALTLLLVVAAAGMAGGAWGRPLRIRGETVDATLGGEGTRWARGPRPDIDGLDPMTRQALGRMWLHDAKKEHGSVPAFSQLAWQLAAIGAPPELLAGCQHAALQEIEHTRLCFALAETYLAVEIRVGPVDAMAAGMPRLGDPIRCAIRIATETLRDGCLIEDVNADFAELAHAQATDPAARALAACIAKEERQHAELAWDILAWCAALHPRVADAIQRAADKLPGQILLPYSTDTVEIVDKASPRAMQAHARVPFSQWQSIYTERLARTRERAAMLLGSRNVGEEDSGDRALRWSSHAARRDRPMSLSCSTED